MKAFSFLEVIISVAIASIVFVAVFALAFQNLTAAEATRDRFIAANLAQEGIEIVVNMRSGNWLTFKDDVDLSDGSLTKWRGDTGCAVGGNGCLPGGTNYIVQYDSMHLTTDANPANQRLTIDDTAKHYCHVVLGSCTGRLSPFSRTITIVTESAHQMKVVATVSWADGTVQVESRLYNWR